MALPVTRPLPAAAKLRQSLLPWRVGFFGAGVTRLSQHRRWL